MLDLAALQLPGQATALLLVMARVTAFVATAPVLSARLVPMRVRLMIGLVLGFTAATAADLAPVNDVSPLMVVAETVTGLLMGSAARASLEAALAAGALFSGQIGISFMSSIDPLSGTDTGTGTVSAWYDALVEWMTTNTPSGGVVVAVQPAE